MDILMIYWNSVWAHGRPNPASFLADHSSTEMRAFERRLHPTPEDMRAQSALHLADRRWRLDHPGSDQTKN